MPLRSAPGAFAAPGRVGEPRLVDLLSDLVTGQTIRLPGRHAKVNRDGYIRRRRGGPTQAICEPMMGSQATLGGEPYRVQQTDTSHRHTNPGSLFCCTLLYGHVPGRQAEYLHMPQTDFASIKVPAGLPVSCYLFLSDVLPTAGQAVAYTDGPRRHGRVFGPGPIGQMAGRVATHQEARLVLGIDLVPKRPAMERRHGVEILDPTTPTTS